MTKFECLRACLDLIVWGRGVITGIVCSTNICMLRKKVAQVFCMIIFWKETDSRGCLDTLILYYTEWEDRERERERWIVDD